jgi:hypothetical protein
MPCPSKKKSRAMYFQRRNHRQKGVERRWRDKYVELERQYEGLLEISSSFFVWMLIIIFLLFVLLFTFLLAN